MHNIDMKHSYYFMFLFISGGQLGLWIGISIITLAEVLELICDLVRMVFSIGKRLPRHHRELQLRKQRMSKVNNCNNSLYLPAGHEHEPEMHGMITRRQNGDVRYHKPRR